MSYTPTRAPSTRMMTQTISTERRTQTTDTSGSTSWTWASSLSAVRASVQTGSSTEALQIAAMRNLSTVDIYLDAGNDITDKDRLTDDSTGKVYNVALQRDLAGRVTVSHIVGTVMEGITSQ